ncbi:hypothetical protein [Sphingobacterium ginsenosidimutans]|uniref:hypothetical protein n=1 Tax=Sphingobacterium ginsenosidimutans TaxID=687845 RepID=UPI0031F79E5C
MLLHFPLRSLIDVYSLLKPDEAKYASHHLTHLDFLLFNRLGMSAVLAIEVDSYTYHAIAGGQFFLCQPNIPEGLSFFS